MEIGVILKQFSSSSDPLIKHLGEHIILSGKSTLPYTEFRQYVLDTFKTKRFLESGSSSASINVVGKGGGNGKGKHGGGSGGFW